MSKKPVATLVQEAAKTDTPIIRLVDLIIESGLHDGANQIHLWPIDDGRLEVQHQKDGKFTAVYYVPSELARHVIARLKIAANCSIQTKTQAQYSRAKTWKPMGPPRPKRIRTYELFVIPTERGEGAVIQIIC